jgi:glutamate racemase
LDPRPIGIFDSGLGGLTVARAVRQALPRERIVYFGDTARIPYGNKSPQTVIRFSRQIARFLGRQRVKFLVVACNTASSWALESLRREAGVPVLGVIEPGAHAAVEVTRNGRIGIIGTEGTVASGAYPRAVRSLRPGARVRMQACPLFVPLVEEGKVSGPVTDLVAREYLRPLLRDRIDTLVLGCTHYPLLKAALQRLVGRHVRIIDSAEETARVLKWSLEQMSLLSKGRGGERFYVSDLSAKFRDHAQRFLGRPIRRVTRVSIERY